MQGGPPGRRAGIANAKGMAAPQLYPAIPCSAKKKRRPIPESEGRLKRKHNCTLTNAKKDANQAAPETLPQVKKTAGEPRQAHPIHRTRQPQPAACLPQATFIRYAEFYEPHFFVRRTSQMKCAKILRQPEKNRPACKKAGVIPPANRLKPPRNVRTQNRKTSAPRDSSPLPPD